MSTSFPLFSALALMYVWLFRKPFFDAWLATNMPEVYFIDAVLISTLPLFFIILGMVDLLTFSGRKEVWRIEQSRNLKNGNPIKNISSSPSFSKFFMISFGFIPISLMCMASIIGARFLLINLGFISCIFLGNFFENVKLRKDKLFLEALIKAKWTLLPRFEFSNSESVNTLVTAHKRWVEESNEAVNEGDIARFFQSAILECQAHYVGPESALQVLLREGQTRTRTLQQDYWDLLRRIEAYRNKDESVPSALLSAQADLESTLERLRGDSQELETQLQRLNRYFEQFSTVLNHLEDTEQDQALLQRIQGNLQSSQNYLDALPAKTLQHYAEISQSLYQLAQGLASGVDSLSLNLALQEATTQNMEDLLEKGVKVTASIPQPQGLI